MKYFQTLRSIPNRLTCFALTSVLSGAVCAQTLPSTTQATGERSVSRFETRITNPASRPTGPFIDAAKIPYATMTSSDARTLAEANWDADGVAAFHWAVGLGLTTVVRERLDKHPEYLDSLYMLTSPLAVAVANGHRELVQLFISRNADLSIGSPHRTPLRVACEFQRPQELNALLVAGITIPDDPDTVSLLVRLAVSKFTSAPSSKDTFDILVRAGAVPKCGSGFSTVVSNATWNTDLLKHVILQVTDNKMLQPALYSCVSTGNTEAAEILINAGADVNAMDEKRGTTPLHAAAWNGQNGMVTLLLFRGASPEAKDREGKTPRQIAASLKLRSTALLLTPPPP